MSKVICGVTAYVLDLNDIVTEDAIIDEDSIARVRMPNVEGFVPDVRGK